ncbi:MAG: hypothetical protein ACRC2H_00950 [Silanimonas sp.]
MTILYRDARQRNRVAAVEFDFSDVPNGVFVPLVELPNSAIITAATLHVVTASNAGTTHVLDIGTAAAPTQLVNDADARTAARVPITPANIVYSGVNRIGVTSAITGGAPTAGRFILFVEYAILGASDFTQG